MSERVERGVGEELCCLQWYVCLRGCAFYASCTTYICNETNVRLIRLENPFLLPSPICISVLFPICVNCFTSYSPFPLLFSPQFVCSASKVPLPSYTHASCKQRLCMCVCCSHSDFYLIHTLTPAQQLDWFGSVRALAWNCVSQK